MTGPRLAYTHAGEIAASRDGFRLCSVTRIEHPTPIAAASKVREAPASLADHFSQARLFWLSMSPTEREHIIAAYTFELSKVYEPAIRQRALTVLAEVDDVLCQEVAAGLGLPAPRAVADTRVEVAPCPALSQIGGHWPATGRVLGIIIGAAGFPVAGRAGRRCRRRRGSAGRGRRPGRW